MCTDKSFIINTTIFHKKEEMNLTMNTANSNCLWCF